MTRTPPAPSYDARVETVARIQRALRVPQPIDLAIAGAIAVWALVEAVAVDGPGTRTLRILVALLYSVPLLWRRRYPIPVLALICAVLLLRVLTADTPDYGVMPFPAMLIATFSVACYVQPLAVALPPVALPVAAMLTTLNTDYWSGGGTPGDVAILCFFVAAAWGAGRVVRIRSHQVAAARAESGDRAREAVAQERTAIARELHDVVAHSVSIIAVQAGAAEAYVDRDPARAREHIGAVRRTAAETLTEMRRLLDVLREDEALYTPQPTLAGLERLVDEVRATGVPVELTREGDVDGLPAGIDLAAYRIVQEALTNVRRHAGGAPTRVHVRRVDGSVEVEVVNAAPTQPGEGPGGGHGLVGMRERVRLYGGSLDAGAGDDGGFAVRARLPVQEPA
jgi:signal transduction histidine kinase